MSKSESPERGSLPPLTPSQLKMAEENLVACLEAYDREADAGLENELLRMYPDPEAPNPTFRRVKIMNNSHVLL